MRSQKSKISGNLKIIKQFLGLRNSPIISKKLKTPFSTKAQISGQIFIYVLAIIIAGLILLYGYRAIGTITKTGEEVALIDFKNQLEGDIEKLATDYGAIKTKSYILPSGTETICFVDSDAKTTATDYQIINDIVASGARQNIFLIPLLNIQIYAEGLKVDESGSKSLCLTNQRGRITLRLEGRGDGTLVTEAPP